MSRMKLLRDAGSAWIVYVFSLSAWLFFVVFFFSGFFRVEYVYIWGWPFVNDNATNINLSEWFSFFFAFSCDFVSFCFRLLSVWAPNHANKSILSYHSMCVCEFTLSLWFGQLELNFRCLVSAHLILSTTKPVSKEYQQWFTN